VNALLLLVLLAAGDAHDPAVVSAPDAVIDKGTYRVYQRGRALGTEVFTFESSGDTLRVFSNVSQVLPGPSGDSLVIDKQAVLIVGRLDYDLKWYQSTIKAGGRDVTRGLVVQDTAFTSYRESSAGVGEGERFHRPPGRLFVIDAQVFVLFDVMCRNLGTTSFKSRPVSVIVLRDETDQVTQINATDHGSETIQWAARPVVARKVSFVDSYSTFSAWIHPRGYMVRLEQEGSGLRVERDPAPPVKRKDGASPR
jgi:hypothetical protein